VPNFAAQNTNAFPHTPYHAAGGGHAGGKAHVGGQACGDQTYGGQAHCGNQARAAGQGRVGGQPRPGVQNYARVKGHTGLPVHVDADPLNHFGQLGRTWDSIPADGRSQMTEMSMWNKFAPQERRDRNAQ
jgi:hypothetical protein